MNKYAAVLLVLVAACDAPQGETSPARTERDAARAAAPERFASFFARFRTDSTFQKARIRDPFVYRETPSPYDDAGERVTKESPDDWHFYDPLTNLGVVGSTRPQRAAMPRGT